MASSTTNNSLPNEKSSIPNQAGPSPTAITRLLYLSSEQLETGEVQSGVPIKAGITLSPTRKVWILPPLQDAVNQYKVNLRNLNIFHTWPSVTTERTLRMIPVTDLSKDLSVTIPVGNWDAYGLAQYINETYAAADIPITVEYDGGRLGFIFTPAVFILAPTDCQDLLGFPDDYVGEIPDDAVESSLIPVRMAGPSRIHVQSNLSLYTFPASGRLATVPVDKNYGELISYFDESGTEPSLCMDHQLNRIEIHLVDQNNEELKYCYESIPWGLVLSLTPINNDGFSSAVDPVLKPETDIVSFEE